MAAFPLVEFGSPETPAMVVWWAQMDKRYIVEVRRIEPSDRTAELNIFDHLNADKLLYTEDVTLAFGALFGPDMDDVLSWQMTATNFIDNKDLAKSAE